MKASISVWLRTSNMSWISRLNILIICLSLFSQYRKTAAINSPWSNMEKLDGFMASFMSGVANSGAFTRSQLEDMNSIKDALMSGVERMFGGSSVKLPQSQLQAMNMAFASSIAEIAISEDGGVSLPQKMHGIQTALTASLGHTREAEKTMSDIMMLATIKMEAKMRSGIKS